MPEKITRFKISKKDKLSNLKKHDVIAGDPDELIDTKLDKYSEEKNILTLKAIILALSVVIKLRERIINLI